MDRASIVRIFLSHMQSYGGPDNSWYVGISQDAETRLFSDHNVSQLVGVWIWKPADTSTNAREVEAYFVNSYHADGAPGGGDILSDQVYAYKKTTYTRP